LPPIRATNVRKTPEVERVRFLAGLRQVPSGKSPEAHDPRLFFCQLQSGFSESIRQVLLELFGIAPVLEIRHEIISNLLRDDDLPQRPLGTVRIAFRPKSIRAFQKTHLEYRFQNPRHRSLQQTVLDRWNSERPSIQAASG
jgi:hypothetical protein